MKKTTLHKLLPYLVISPTSFALATTAKKESATLQQPEGKINAKALTASPFNLSIGAQSGAVQSRFIEALFPFNATKQGVFFVQGRLQHQQKEQTLNLGIGQRLLLNTTWGLGYNAFYDQNLSQTQRRRGLGVELFTHHLKFTANHYFPISQWRTATMVVDHQSRPAKGFDLGVQGYLPQLPQLGASLQYRYYFGQQVAHIEPQHRQKNPRHWHFGLTYTPIPLINMDYRYQTGQQQQHSHQVGLTLTYRFGTPLSLQLDPTQVATLRSLQGALVERVERDSTVVLDHRKIEPKPPVQVVDPINLTDQDRVQLTGVINQAIAFRDALLHNPRFNHIVLTPAEQLLVEEIARGVDVGSALGTSGNNAPSRELVDACRAFADVNMGLADRLNIQQTERHVRQDAANRLNANRTLNRDQSIANSIDEHITIFLGSQWQSHANSLAYQLTAFFKRSVLI